MFSRWIPAGERGLMPAMLFAGAHFTGGVTPILVTALRGFLSWRAIFVVFGAVGFAWVWFWYRWFRDEPADHPSVSPAELEKILSERDLPPAHGHERVLSAAMNTSGQVGGILSPIVLAHVVDIFANWSIPLHVMAGLYLLASISWLLIRPYRPIG